MSMEGLTKGTVSKEKAEEESLTTSTSIALLSSLCQRHASFGDMLMMGSLFIHSSN